MSNQQSLDDFVAKLLRGPVNVELTSEELLLLETCLFNAPGWGLISREKQRYGHSPTQERYRKLKQIRFYNEQLRKLKARDDGPDCDDGPDRDAGDVVSSPTTGSKPRPSGDELAVKLRELLLTVPPNQITVRLLAQQLGVSKSTVQRHPTWLVFEQRRRELATRQLRGVQLTQELLCVLPGPAKTLDDLIAEQAADDASDYAR